MVNGEIELEWDRTTISKSQLKEFIPSATGALKEGTKPIHSDADEIYELEDGHIYNVPVVKQADHQISELNDAVNTLRMSLLALSSRSESEHERFKKGLRNLMSGDSQCIFTGESPTAAISFRSRASLLRKRPQLML